MENMKKTIRMIKITKNEWFIGQLQSRRKYLELVESNEIKQKGKMGTRLCIGNL